MNDLAEDLRDLLVEHHDDPNLFCEQILRRKPRAWQAVEFERISGRLRAGDRHLEVLIRSCHGVGKTWFVAVLVLWWMATRPEARGLTSAPKWWQVETLVWSEINRLFAGSLLAALGVGRCLTTHLEFGPGWFCDGAAAEKPETLEGQHSPTAALRVIDEAKAVPSSVFTVTEGLLAAPESLDLWVSTPNLRTGEFYERDMHGGPGVLRRVFTVDDGIAEGIEGLAEWKAKRLARWGETNPLYRSRVMAEYIEEGFGSLYKVADVERAMAHEWSVNGAPVAGEDVAGSVDGDENVLALVHGPDELGRYEARVPGAWSEQDTMVSKGRALALLREHGARGVRVDAIGLGKGLHDALRMDFPRCSEYRASEAAEDTEQFANRKAEDAWFVRGLLEQGRLRLPADPVTRSQFVGMRYEITPQGRIRVVDPSDSPDRHDAILIALSWFSRPGVDLRVNPVIVIPGRSAEEGWGSL